MEDDERYRDILRRYWGYDDFRGIQLDIIRSIGRGCDTIGLMPTGGGKSITFQVPALAIEGLCLVVTPLIALMKDQVARLRQLGIRAAAIYSGLSAEEVARQLDNCVFGGYKFLYVAPERLGSEAFRRRLGHMRVSFVTIDEAHCLSQWGFDFRPSYLNLCELNELLPGVPLLALTATATERVLTDIREVLKRPGMRLFRMSFERTNLSYVVRPTTDKDAQLVHILRSVPGAAIVYTRSRRGAADTASMLTRAGIGALYYHAGLPPVEKDVRQDDWQQGHTRVMVATNAFGMGIDKADVRLVVHMDMPDSIEAYFQEAGRAGRDGRRAYAVLLYSEADRTKMLRRVADTFPPKEFVQRVYSSLAYFFQLAVGDGFGVTYEFDLERFCVNFKYFPTRVLSALHILTRTGLILYRDEEEGASRVMFIVQRDELYNLHRLTPRMDRVILSLLRRYTGLFSDYAFIDETLIGRDCGLNRPLRAAQKRAACHLPATARRGEPRGHTARGVRNAARTVCDAAQRHAGLCRGHRLLPLALPAGLLRRDRYDRLRPLRRMPEPAAQGQAHRGGCRGHRGAGTPPGLAPSRRNHARRLRPRRGRGRPANARGERPPAAQRRRTLCPCLLRPPRPKSRGRPFSPKRDRHSENSTF